MSEHKVNKMIWDLTPLLGDKDDIKVEKALAKAKRECYKFINKWKNREDYHKNPEVLKEALDDLEALNKKHAYGGDVAYYFWLRSQQDMQDSDIKSKVNKIDDMFINVVNDMEFFTQKISRIPKKDQTKFLNYKPLNSYKHLLEKLFASAKYLLSEPEEKILNLKSTTSYSNWVKMTAEFISKEERKVVDKKNKKVNKSFEEILNLVNDPSKKIRNDAAKVLNEIFIDNIDVATSELNSILHDKKVNDELRKTKRPDELSHIGDDMESKVVDTLLQSVVDSYDLSKRYYKLKAKLFGVAKLKYHERNLDYGSLKKKYPFSKAVSLVSNTLERLDPEFSDIFLKMIDNNQFDVFPKKNKKGGAVCVHNLISQPTYVLLNYTNKLNDVITLAHEMGHALNNEFMRANQNSLNFGSPLSMAEVSSTFMEDFVIDEISGKLEGEEKLAINMFRLNDFVSTVIRQVACYKFEQELHKTFRDKNYLSKEEIGKIFQKHMKSYMGKYVEQSEGAENWWIYWSHIRRYFYVYTYASGLLISKSLQSIVKANPEEIRKFKEILKVGGSKSPKQVFKELGMNISSDVFWKKGIEEYKSLLKATEVLAKKLGYK